MPERIIRPVLTLQGYVDPEDSDKESLIHAALDQIAPSGHSYSYLDAGSPRGYQHHRFQEYTLRGMDFQQQLTVADIKTICAAMREAGFIILSCGFEIPLPPGHCARRVITELPLPEQSRDVGEFISALCTRTYLSKYSSDVAASIPYGHKDSRTPLTTLQWRTKAVSTDGGTEPETELEASASLYIALKHHSIGADIPQFAHSVEERPVFEVISDIETEETSGDDD